MGQFHQHFMCSCYGPRSQKRQKYSKACALHKILAKLTPRPQTVVYLITALTYVAGSVFWQTLHTQLDVGSIGSIGTRYPGRSIEQDGHRSEENSVPSSVGSKHRGHLYDKDFLQIPPFSGNWDHVNLDWELQWMWMRHLEPIPQNLFFFGNSQFLHYFMIS